MQENEEVIDLAEVKKIVCQYKKRLLGIVVGVTLLALVLAFLLPNEYESTALVRAKSQQQGGAAMQASAALALLGGSSQSPTQGYIAMMKSRSVLDPIIDGLDLPPEKKEKLDNEKFAKKYLEFETTKGTDLIEVTGTGRTPEEAQQIAGGVVDNFRQLLTRLNQSDQSLLRKFLDERIQIAKKELDEAEQSLEKYRQQEQVFLPDEQAKAIVEKMAIVDQKVAEADVENQANQAKLQGIDQQLARQNSAIASYQLADNPEIQQLRASITTKEMELVEQEQRYTDKHPNVILAQKEIDELKGKLKLLVSQSVAAGTTTLNPLQMGLLQGKAETEAGLLSGQAALDGLRRIQGKNEQEISQLSAKGVSYVGLMRKVTIAQDVYATLVQQYEQARIQEAMESMDIQIVDEANLPKLPSAPKKLLITAVGFVIGIMLSFIYTIVLYQKTRNI